MNIVNDNSGQNTDDVLHHLHIFLVAWESRRQFKSLVKMVKNVVIVDLYDYQEKRKQLQKIIP